MDRSRTLLLSVFVAGISSPVAHSQTASLTELRRGFDTDLSRRVRDDEPLAEPDPDLFSRVEYRGPAGRLSAYLGRRPTGAAPSEKHPAILWVTGGFPPGGAGSNAWKPVDQENDQSAKAYREAGFVMMYPSFRGAFGNDGYQEGFLGEIDDLLAALKYARSVSYIDPDRIFLGGHSTGGTVALPAAASTDGFRAVVSLGPVSDPLSYGESNVLHDPDDEEEARLRAPIHHLQRIRTPTLVVEGAGGNAFSLEQLSDASENELLHFVEVPGTDHFEVLAATNRVVARKMLDLADGERLRVTESELVDSLLAQRLEMRKADLLGGCAVRLRRGGRIDRPLWAEFRYFSDDRSRLQRAIRRLSKLDFLARSIDSFEEDGETWFVVDVRKLVVPSDFEAMFQAAEEFVDVQTEFRLEYGGWEFLEH